MMLKVYNGEVFERPKWRYILFVLGIFGLIILSFVYDNMIWAIFLLFLLWGYAYLQTKVTQKIQIQIWETSLDIANRQFAYSQIKWFLFEWEVKSKKILNFVLVFDSHHEVFTITDSPENIERFAQKLNQYLPALDHYEQSTIDKLMRKLKI